MATIHSQSDQSSDSGVHHKFPRISGFTVLEHLHEGSHSSIYRARQDRLGRVVALKLLPEWPPPTDVALERFNRAAYVMAQAPNSNLCTLFDTGTRDGFHFASMEFVAGQTLQRQLAQVPHTDESFAIHVGLQVARALVALHAKDICHRNVKPKNIFVETTGNIRLIGLGLASCKSAFFSPHLDAHAIGTPHFMAPEMIRGCCADPRSDLYSLGVTLYLMTAGRPPFEAGIPAAVMTRHLTDSPKSLAQQRPDLSPDFVNVVNLLIARDPEQRYQSARSVVEALEKLAVKHREKTAQSRSLLAPRAAAAAAPAAAPQQQITMLPPEPSVQQHNQHAIVVAVMSAIATVVVLCVMALGLFWLWGGKGASPAPAPAKARPAPVAAPLAVEKEEALTAELREFRDLQARETEYTANPEAGADAWATFLNTFPNGDPVLQKQARERLDKYLRLMNQMTIRQRPAANTPAPAARKQDDMDF
ncbi:MAG TPA: serine/threonine-protein kinase [Planctomycetota bacterium]|nr:serine/threonine-protein kinase [Planctomycetota bacterium]